MYRSVVCTLTEAMDTDRMLSRQCSFISRNANASLLNLLTLNVNRYTQKFDILICCERIAIQDEINTFFRQASTRRPPAMAAKIILTE